MVGGRKPRRRARHYSRDPLPLKVIDRRQPASDYPPEGREWQEFGGYMVQNQLNSVSEPTQILTNADYYHQGSSAPAVSSGQKNSVFFDDRVARTFYTLPGTGYMIQDQLNSVSEATQVLTNTNNHHQGCSAPAPDVSSGQKNSMFFDDEVARNFCTLPLGTGYVSSAAKPKSDSMGVDVGINGGFGYSDVLRCRGMYEERDKENACPRDTSFMVPSSQALTFRGTSSSSYTKDQSPEVYDTHIGRPYSVGISKLSNGPLEWNELGQVNVSGFTSQGEPPQLIREGAQKRAFLQENARPRDTSFMVPSSQALTFRGISSSSYSKDQLPEVYDTHIHRPYSVGISKLSNGPLEWNDLSQVNVNVSGFTSQGEPPQLIREGSQKRAFLELSTSEKIAQGFLVSDNVYKNVQWSDTGDTRGSSYTDLTGGRIDRENTTHRFSSENSLRHQQPSLHRDASVEYHDMKMVSRDGSFRIESSRDDEFAVLAEKSALSRDPTHIAYRERSRSPLMTDRHRDMYQRGVSLSRGIRHKVDMHMYDLSSERTSRGNYGIGRNVNQFHSRGTVSGDRNSFRRMQTPSGSDDILNDDIMELPPLKKYARGLPHYRMSASDACLSGDSSARSKGSQRMSLKQRLKPASSKFPGSSPPEKRDGVCRPFNKKLGKRDSTDQHTSTVTHLEDASVVSPPPLPKPDPPEDSEEFKRQVQKAFLRFSKVLNESAHQQRKYLEQGNAGSLSCGVCGSLSKEYVDTHSLVSHTYSSCKVGLRAQHLGLHKALCFLMGWNWLMHPNNKLYKSSPVSEAKVLKEDLILWPPLVIIHNSSISNRINTNGAKVVSVEGVEDILRDMGFGAGKAGIRHGKPANQSVFIVKFLPTLSGLQESERLHKHFAGKNHGRLEFQQITSDSSSDGKEIRADVEKVDDGKEIRADLNLKTVDELLYGYMAGVEDLDKLDQETKKRCLVRSKKDFEAIADAPIK